MTHVKTPITRYPYERVAGENKVRQKVIQSAGAGVYQIVEANPARLVLVVQGLTGVPVMSLDPNAATGTGFSLPLTANPLSFIIGEHGPLTQQAWYMPAADAATSLIAVEVVASGGK